MGYSSDVVGCSVDVWFLMYTVVLQETCRMLGVDGRTVQSYGRFIGGVVQSYTRYMGGVVQSYTRYMGGSWEV